MNVLTIIGNGFDLAHDLPTNFNDFVYSNFNVFSKKYSVFSSGDSTWNSTEEKYAKLLLEVMDERNCFDVLEEVDQIIQDYGLNEYGEVDYYNYSSNSFNETYEKIILYINLLKEFEIDFFKYLKTTCGDNRLVKIIPFKKVSKIITRSNKIINFNYTNTIEVVYKKKDVIHIHGSINDNIAIGSGALDDAKTSVVDYEYPTMKHFGKDKHGFAEMMAYYEENSEGNLVEHHFIKRFFDEVSAEISESEEELFELLDEKSKDSLEFRKQTIEILKNEHYDKVYIIGHSLGLADFEVLNAINSDAEVVCYYHGTKDGFDYMTKVERIKEYRWKCELESDVDIFKF